MPLVERHGPGLRRFLCRRTESVEAAEELLQEVWRQVLESHRRLKDPDRLVGWLYGIARNVVSRSRRRFWREVPLERAHARGEGPEGEEIIEIAILDPGTDDPRERVDAEAVQGRLKTMLEGLSDSAQEMITMRFYDGLTTGQIAEALDAPVGTVCSTIHRGLRRLRDSLHRQGLSLEDLT